MLRKKPPPQISVDKSDFDEPLDAFLEELDKLHEKVMREKNFLSDRIYTRIFYLRKSAFCSSEQFF